MSTNDLRRDVRLPMRVPLVVYRGKNEIPVESTDVSFRGLFLTMSDPPPLRSLVRLRVTLPLCTFDTHAMVVHAVEDEERGTGVGLQFWGLSGSDRRAWDDFINKLVSIRTQTTRRQAGASSK